MKEIIKNKTMLLFAAFIIGITYFHAVNSKKMEENNNTEEKQYIAINIK